MVSLSRQTRIQRERAMRHRRQCEVAVLEEARLRYEWVARWLLLNTKERWEFTQSFPLERVTFEPNTFYIRCSCEDSVIVLDLWDSGYDTVMKDRLERAGIRRVSSKQKRCTYYWEGIGLVTSDDGGRLLGIKPNSFRMRSKMGWSVQTMREYPGVLSSQWEKAKASYLK